jgi:hypothetical protein
VKPATDRLMCVKNASNEPSHFAVFSIILFLSFFLFLFFSSPLRLICSSQAFCSQTPQIFVITLAREYLLGNVITKQMHIIRNVTNTDEEGPLSKPRMKIHSEQKINSLTSCIYYLVWKRNKSVKIMCYRCLTTMTPAEFQ